MTSPAYGVVILNSYAVFANIVGHFWRGPHLEDRLTGMRVFGLAVAIAGLTVLTMGQAPKKRLLVVGAEQGYRHESVSHAMAVLERMGLETGEWELLSGFQF